VATNRILLDSGALTAFGDGDQALRVAIRRATTEGIDVAVPTIVIAESTTGNGSIDANVNRVLKDLELVELSTAIARRAAALRYRYKAAGVPDAVVIATADAIAGTVVYTSDPRDLVTLAAITRRTTVVTI